MNVATAAFLPSIGKREDRNNIFDFFETILVFLVVKCRLFLEVTWFLGSFCFRFLECLVLGGGLVSQSYIGGHL